MEQNLTYLLIIIIGFISLLTTIILALRAKRKKIFKYLPTIIIGVLAIVYCIIMTILHYYKYGRGGYIGILYVVVLIVTSPAIFFSLLTAGFFDIFDLYRKRK